MKYCPSGSMDAGRKTEHTAILTDHIQPDRLELYVPGRASAEEAAEIEAHLLRCEMCGDRLNDTALYFATVRGALIQVRGILAVHATEDGLVCLSARKHGKKWVARIRGAGVDAGRKLATEKAASR